MNVQKQVRRPPKWGWRRHDVLVEILTDPIFLGLDHERAERIATEFDVRTWAKQARSAQRREDWRAVKAETVREAVLRVLGELTERERLTTTETYLRVREVIRCGKSDVGDQLRALLADRVVCRASGEAVNSARHWWLA